ncbi:MAG: T9SS type A sorting domain-containing protein [Flavobacteriales bacterium]
MIRTLTLSALVAMATGAAAQSWTRLSTNADSLWAPYVRYANMGDTLVYFSRVAGGTKYFYTSTDGGNTFQHDPTGFDDITNRPIQGLPLNRMLVGFKNAPIYGSYSFNGVANWPTLFAGADAAGIYGDVSLGTIMFQPWGSPNVYTMPAAGGALTQVYNGSVFNTMFNSNGRLLFGTSSGDIGYVDGGNFSGLQWSTVASGAGIEQVVKFFHGAGGSLWVVSYGSHCLLHKSMDNGATWSEVTTTWNDGGNTYPLYANDIMGCPNGNLFFILQGGLNAQSTFLSTDGGLTAQQVSNGLPGGDSDAQELLANGNKVWLHVRAASTVDFISVDTTRAGLYLFDAAASLNEDRGSAAFQLYPNPTNGDITLAFAAASVENSVEVRNAMGQLVLFSRSGGQRMELDLGHVPAGIYIVTVRSSVGIHARRLIKE